MTTGRSDRNFVNVQFQPVLPISLTSKPDAFGQKRNLQVLIAPVIPKLITGNVLEEW